VISSLTASAGRAEAGSEVVVTAVVTDAETAVSELQFAWSAVPTAGTFSGSGLQVRWTAPAGAASPGTYQIRLTVSERYVSQGQLLTNATEGLTGSIHYNDSLSEINELATQFYQDFGTFSTSANQCVRNFSNSCRGKAEERDQIQDNRDRTDYRIVGSALFGTPLINVRASQVEATFAQRCRFEDVEIRSGHRWRAEGDCLLTAVYEDWRWWLCTSSFVNGVVTGPVGLEGQFRLPSEHELRLMTPGRR
jgi:hypothetical protein